MNSSNEFRKEKTQEKKTNLFLNNKYMCQYIRNCTILLLLLQKLYLQDRLLEKNLFLKQVMPWGEMSVNYNMNPMNSDDGPIIWARPGEQMIPTSNLKDQHMLMSSNTISNNNSTNEIGKKKK